MTKTEGAENPDFVQKKKKKATRLKKSLIASQATFPKFVGINCGRDSIGPLASSELHYSLRLLGETLSKRTETSLLLMSLQCVLGSTYFCTALTEPLPCFPFLPD